MTSRRGREDGMSQRRKKESTWPQSRGRGKQRKAEALAKEEEADEQGALPTRQYK